jgi:hypothetical protein
MIIFIAGFLAGAAVMSVIAYFLNEFNQPAHRANRSRPAFRAKQRPKMIPVREIFETAHEVVDVDSDAATMPVNVVPLRRSPADPKDEYRPRHARE